MYRGGPTTIFSKILFGEAKLAWNFLLLEDGSKFLDNRSVHVQINCRSLSNKFPMIFRSLIFTLTGDNGTTAKQDGAPGASSSLPILI